MTTTKTFWLSFCDGSRPKGQQFLGVSVVDVTEEEAVDAALERPYGDRWVVAACKKAWAMECNPGGSMMSAEMTSDLDKLPRNRLMQAAELKSLGLIA